MKQPDLFGDDPHKFISALQGEARHRDPETSKESARKPKGEGARKVLAFLAVRAESTQLDNERYYRDTKRSLGPRFKDLERIGWAERVLDAYGNVKKVEQDGTSRELWRITPQGRVALAELNAKLLS